MVVQNLGLINFRTHLLCPNFFQHVDFLHETFVTRKFPDLWYSNVPMNVILCHLV